VKVNVMEATCLRVKEAFRFVRLPVRDIKGKDVMQTHFVEDER